MLTQSVYPWVVRSLRLVCILCIGMLVLSTGVAGTSPPAVLAQEPSIEEIALLTIEDALAGSWFGTAVAINGNTMAIGAPGVVPSDAEFGVVYVFERNAHSPSTWEPTAELRASDEYVYSRFGAAIAIDGDMMVVGAPGHGDQAGTAYLFTRNPDTSGAWEESIRLSAGEEVAFFGEAVAIHGPTVVVGSPSEDDLYGAAYVFEQNHGGADNWGQTARLTGTQPVEFTQFGSSVSIDGNTLVVGVPAFGPIVAPGAAYVFSKAEDDVEWLTTAILQPEGAPTGFGSTVRVQGARIAVGSPYDDELGAGAGAVHLFEGTDSDPSGWTEVVKLTTAAGEGFGTSLDIQGDQLVVGAPISYYSDHPEEQTGSAYLFEHSPADQTWRETLHWEGSATVPGDNFGGAIAMRGDTIVVGAPDHAIATYAEGAAYVFQGLVPTALPAVPEPLRLRSYFLPLTFNGR